GGLFISGGAAVTASNCNFVQNLAQAGANSGGFSFPALGGGIDVDFFGSSLQLSDSTLTGNEAVGGAGEAGANGGAGMPGGGGAGGGIAVDTGATATVSGVHFLHNLAQGGAGGAGGAGAAGGSGGTGQ